MCISNLKKLHFDPHVLEEVHRLFTGVKGRNSFLAADMKPSGVPSISHCVSLDS